MKSSIVFLAALLLVSSAVLHAAWPAGTTERHTVER